MTRLIFESLIDSHLSQLLYAAPPVVMLGAQPLPASLGRLLEFAPLAFEWVLLAAVEEEGDVRVLLGLGAAKLPHAARRLTACTAVVVSTSNVPVSPRSPIC